MDRGPKALDLVEGPLELDLPFLEASASEAGCLEGEGEEPLEINQLRSTM